MLDKLKLVGDPANEESYPYIDDKGVSWQSKRNYLQIQHIGLCGCGSPDEYMCYVEKMLTKLSQGDLGDYENMAYMTFMYWFNQSGYLDHGVSIRCSFLTAKGKELLRDIRTVIKEEM